MMVLLHRTRTLPRCRGCQFSSVRKLSLQVKGPEKRRVPQSSRSCPDHGALFQTAAKRVRRRSVPQASPPPDPHSSLGIPPLLLCLKGQSRMSSQPSPPVGPDRIAPGPREPRARASEFTRRALPLGLHRRSGSSDRSKTRGALHWWSPTPQRPAVRILGRRLGSRKPPTAKLRWPCA